MGSIDWLHSILPATPSMMNSARNLVPCFMNDHLLSLVVSCSVHGLISAPPNQPWPETTALISNYFGEVVVW